MKIKMSYPTQEKYRQVENYVEDSNKSAARTEGTIPSHEYVNVDKSSNGRSGDVQKCGPAKYVIEHFDGAFQNNHIALGSP
jgi:hypothetical protein